MATTAKARRAVSSPLARGTPELARITRQLQFVCYPKSHFSALISILTKEPAGTAGGFTLNTSRGPCTMLSDY